MDDLGIDSGLGDVGCAPNACNPEQRSGSRDIPAAIQRVVGDRSFSASPTAASKESRPQTANAAVRDIAQRLFARGDPTSASEMRAAITREVKHYYAPTVLQPADAFLREAVTSGGRCFLQGACHGVGSTFLALDFARACNLRAAEIDSRQRVLYVRFEPGTNSVPKFYDTLGLCTRAPLTNTELRSRSPLYFALRVLAGAIMTGATAIILDHVSATPSKVREGIGTLLRLTDPNYSASTELAAYGEVPRRIGVVVVDHASPEKLFRNAPDVLLLLENKHVVLQPYRTAEEIGEAIRQAGIGLDDFNNDDPSDAAIADIVMERTRGLPAQMTPLFQLIDTVARLNGGLRPTPEVVSQALPFYRNMVEMVSVPISGAPPKGEDASGERLYGVYSRDAVALPETLTDAQRRKLFAMSAPSAQEDAERDGQAGTRKGGASSTSAMQKGRSAALREKREKRAVANREGASMQRKRHVNLEYGDAR